ncbi:MAG: zinc ribbon domain-containing protein [Planctomycetota bacterium]
MPVYEYRCEKCEHLTEALRRMSDADDPMACEKCGTDQTRRVQSAFASTTGGADAAPMDCGMPGGCCGGMCSGH